MAEMQLGPKEVQTIENDDIAADRLVSSESRSQALDEKAIKVRPHGVEALT